MKILYAEDEVKINMLVEEALQKEGYTVDACMDGEKAYKLFWQNDYNLVILDLMMPGLTGSEVMRKIREKNKKVPILALTALSDLETVTENLDSGFDDYLVKPFKIEELKSRIRALLRRSTSGETILSHQGLTLDPVNKIVKLDNDEIELTSKEYKILELLLRHKGKYFNQQELIDNIWDISADIASNSVAVHIKNLKRKVERKKDKIEIITSSRGFGYKIG
ncbi:response regulator transcription factor [bacterium]|nr:MAG: response regulator transcription factor [bacterium]